MPGGRAFVAAGATGEIVVERIHGQPRDLQRNGSAPVARPEAIAQGGGQSGVRHGARRRPVRRQSGVHFFRITTVGGELTGRFQPGFPAGPVQRRPRPRSGRTPAPDVVSPSMGPDRRRAKKRSPPTRGASAGVQERGTDVHAPGGLSGGFPPTFSVRPFQGRFGSGQTRCNSWAGRFHPENFGRAKNKETKRARRREPAGFRWAAG